MKQKSYLPMMMILLLGALTVNVFSQSVQNEMTGIDNEKPYATGLDAVRGTAAFPSGGLLLVPESTNDRVMAFDPVTGDLVDANFIPPDPTHLSTPKEVILSATGQSLLVADQIEDAVLEYDLEGNYIGLFAPAGGVDIDIMDNIRGIELRPNGNLLVTVAGSTNANKIIEFGTNGTYLGIFFDGTASSTTSPFDVYLRPGVDYLVSGWGLTRVASVGLDGSFNASFASVETEPEQIFMTTSGNILVGNFGGAQEGVVEFTSAGALVGVYDPPAIGGMYRGVYELPDGNILTASFYGVYVIDHSGNLIDTKYDGTGPQYITFIQPEQKEIPLSPYMIILAVGLIALLTYFRMRK